MKSWTTLEKEKEKRLNKFLQENPTFKNPRPSAMRRNEEALERKKAKIEKHESAIAYYVLTKNVTLTASKFDMNRSTIRRLIKK